jgi:hypothetical protein
MNSRTTKIARRLAVVVLAVTTAALVAPAAQASDRIVDDWFRDTPMAPAVQSVRPTGLSGDNMFRAYFRNLDAASKQSSDRLVDDWFRDSSPASVALRPQGLDGDYMFRDYLHSLGGTSKQASDSIVDDWFRDAPAATLAASSNDGLGQREILGAAGAVAAALLLGGIVLGRRQVRLTRHSIEGA